MEGNSEQALVPAQCCLLAVDFQERLLAHIHDAKRVIRAARLMLGAAPIFRLPVVATTQYSKGVGPVVEPVRELLDTAPPADKTEFNALANREVNARLAELPSDVDTLLIMGVESHICIYQTVRGALDRGYRVQVVADAVSSRTAENDLFGRQRMAAMGAVMAPAEMIVYEFLQRAGTQEFKAVLPLVK